MAQLVRKDIEIDGELFALDKIPNANSALVAHTRDNLLGSLDLKGLVTDLGKLGNFIRLAYNGVAGHTELQIKVQRVGYKITDLADKSAVTVHSFKVTSRDVLQELQGTYEYLLDGLEEMALETLSGLSVLAGKMAKASEELHTEFEKAAEDVISALEKTQIAKGDEEKHKERLRKEQKEFEIAKSKAEQSQRDAIEAEANAAKMINEAQKREDKAYEKQTSLMGKLTDSLGKLLDAGLAVGTIQPAKVLKKLSEIGDNSAHKDAMKQASAEKARYMEEKLKQQNLRRDANLKLIEFVERIKNCEGEEGLAKIAIDALHSSIGALKSLSAIMKGAALFWKEMKTHCESIESEDMKKHVMKAMEFDEGKRLKVWTSNAFKRKAIMYYSKWVALDDVCGTYMAQIKETRADLYEYLKENPTKDESLSKVNQLAITFKEDLIKSHKEMEKKNIQARKEIQELKSIQ